MNCASDAIHLVPTTQSTYICQDQGARKGNALGMGDTSSLTVYYENRSMMAASVIMTKQKKPSTPDKSNARLLLKNSTSYGIRTRDLRLERAASKAARRTRLVAAVCVHTFIPTLRLYSIHMALSSKICDSDSCN